MTKTCICCGDEVFPESDDPDDPHNRYCEGCIISCCHLFIGACHKPKCKAGQTMDYKCGEFVCLDDNCECSLDDLDGLDLD